MLWDGKQARRVAYRKTEDASRLRTSGRGGRVYCLYDDLGEGVQVFDSGNVDGTIIPAPPRFPDLLLFDEAIFLGIDDPSGLEAPGDGPDNLEDVSDDASTACSGDEQEADDEVEDDDDESCVASDLVSSDSSSESDEGSNAASDESEDEGSGDAGASDYNFDSDAASEGGRRPVAPPPPRDSRGDRHRRAVCETEQSCWSPVCA